MSLTPDEIRDYLLDELSPARRAAVGSELQSDPSARAELERQQALLEALRCLPEEEVPRRLVFVSEPSPATPAADRAWLGLLARRPTPAALAVLGLLFFVGIWASDPAFTRHDSGWTVSFGRDASLAPTWTEPHLREILRDELDRSETRWRSALRQASQSAAGTEWTRSEFEALRRELAAMHEDAVAGYEFVNAKHELLKRQLLEFEMASVVEVQP